MGSAITSPRATSQRSLTNINPLTSIPVISRPLQVSGARAGRQRCCVSRDRDPREDRALGCAMRPKDPCSDCHPPLIDDLVRQCEENVLPYPPGEIPGLPGLAQALQAVPNRRRRRGQRYRLAFLLSLAMVAVLGEQSPPPPHRPPGRSGGDRNRA